MPPEDNPLYDTYDLDAMAQEIARLQAELAKSAAIQRQYASCTEQHLLVCKVLESYSHYACVTAYEKVNTEARIFDAKVEAILTQFDIKYDWRHSYDNLTEFIQDSKLPVQTKTYILDAQREMKAFHEQWREVEEAVRIAPECASRNSEGEQDDQESSEGS